MKRTLLLLTLVAAATFGTACAFESKTESLLPTDPGPVPAATPPSAPNSPYAGTWTTDITLPTVGSCGDFQWHVTSETSTSMEGYFSATCGNETAISGSASGQLLGTSVAVTVTGTGTYAGSVSCNFSLSGTGTIENNDTLTIPYTGTTCLGPVSGTARLRRPAPAAEPTPEPAPSPVDPLFGCGGIPNKEELVECIWDHIHPTDSNSAFEVTKRVAWALRGEGAGLLLKNGGDNVTAWRGYLFSSSRICYPDGRLVKVIYDAGPGGANGPSWQDNGDYVSPGLYFPAMDPTLP